MTMNVLFVYAPAMFEIESKIEFLAAGNAVEVIEPGERLLAPGVYRFADSVEVTPVRAINGSSGDAQMFAVPNEKIGWPDPPLAGTLENRLGVTRSVLIDFLGGTNVQTEL